MPAKREIVLLLRWVLIIALCYLVVFDARVDSTLAGLLAALLLTSNVVLGRLPKATFERQSFYVGLVVVDVVSITAVLFVCRNVGPDFFFVFFFVLFLAALGERLELTVLGAVLVAIAYLLFVHPEGRWGAGILLRLPFLFIAAMTYGYLANTSRVDRARAESLEAILSHKRAFFASMSHEVRTPLHVIVGYSEVLRQQLDKTLGKEQQAMLKKIADEATDAATLVDRILDVSRVESSAVGLARDVIDMEALMTDVEAAMKAWRKPEVRLMLILEPGMPRLVTDRLKLKELMINLVSNALKYTEEGAVVVEARLAGQRCLEISVEDTGRGLTQEMRDVMFDPFSRSSVAVVEGVRGTGLGLYIVRRLVDLLGASITVVSEPGRGSTFTVRLPCEPIDASIAASQDSTNAPRAATPMSPSVRDKAA